MVGRHLWINLQRSTLWLSAFVLNAVLFDCQSTYSKIFLVHSVFVKDISGQWGTMHIFCYLGFESFVVCDAPGDKVDLNHVWKDRCVRWSLCLVRMGVNIFSPPVAVYVKECSLDEE